MKTLRYIAAGIAFLLLCTPAFAGRYQRTLDKKSHIWNDDPKLGEEVNWIGGRDRMDLADGPGTLTWYRAEQGPTTRVRFSEEKLHFVSTLKGTMLRGRWEGVVEAIDADGHISHALFDNGKLAQAWVDGSAPAQSKTAPKQPVAERHEEAAVKPVPAVTESTPSVAVVTAKSAPSTPKPSLPKNPETAPVTSKVPTEFSIEPKPLVQNSSSVPARSTPVPTTSMLAPPPQSPVRSGGSLLSDPVISSSGSGSAGDLFHSLAAPPSLLQHRASLSPREATKIAEAELDRQGLKLSDYPRRQLTYNPDSDSWFVSYEHGAGNESAPGPARLGVTVDDKSGNVSSTH